MGANLGKYLPYHYIWSNYDISPTWIFLFPLVRNAHPQPGMAKSEHLCPNANVYETPNARFRRREMACPNFKDFLASSKAKGETTCDRSIQKGTMLLIRCPTKQVLRHKWNDLRMAWKPRTRSHTRPLTSKSEIPTALKNTVVPS